MRVKVLCNGLFLSNRVVVAPTTRLSSTRLIKLGNLARPGTPLPRQESVTQNLAWHFLGSATRRNTAGGNCCHGIFTEILLQTVETEECRDVEEEECDEAAPNPPQCRTVTEESCSTELSQECNTVNDLVCEAVLEEQCDTVEEEQCEQVQS